MVVLSFGEWMESLGTILVVDDSESVVDLMTEILERDGYAVHGAYSAEEALLLLAQQHVDVLITDINMPGMDGMELIGIVGREYPRVETIVCTGFADKKTAIRAMQLGAINYLEKPINTEELLVAVRHGIEKNQLVRTIQQVHDRINEEKTRSRTILDAVQAGVLLINAVTHEIVDANPAACAMIGLPSEKVIGSVCHRFVCPAQQGKCPITDLNQNIDNSERVLIQADGTERAILKTVSFLTQGDNKYLVESFVDISNRKKIEQDLQESRETFHAIVERSLDGVVIVDKAGKVKFLNQAAADLLGYSRAELDDREFGFPVASGETTELNIIRKDLKNKVSEMRVAEADWKGERVFVVSLRDITERKEIERHMQYLASHDQLTELPNRYLLNDRLVQMLKLAGRNEEKLAVLFVDLDGFKFVNDTWGHSAGDEVLVETAERLKSSARASDTVGRVGGDEFVVALHNPGDREDIVRFAEKMLGKIASPYKIDGTDYRLGCSIGISIFPEDGGEPGELVKNADIAMYRVKQSGKNGYAFFGDGKISAGPSSRPPL